ncbi:MAG TPA: CDP-alcohol phosphatidyltransferase family protein [Nocardioidaceae bacterium]|nr:CDP-alcohol phosphatidyltransferase family protein [Nocardioidaceae bacterium]
MAAMPRVWDGSPTGLGARRYQRVATLGPGPSVGLTALVALLAILAMAVGLSTFGWVVGLTCGVVINVAVARGLALTGADALGPADWVTLTRATFACGVAALVADSFLRQPAVTTLLVLTVAALLLDAVDGWLARRTHTVSTFGARFDGETDAFLILVLSVYVASSVAAWVLAIGAARYVFAVAGWGLPWLRRQLPRRYWRKVVAATQGVVLALAAAALLPLALTYAALAVAAALLAESFGRDVWWLWRRRRASPAATAETADPAGGRRRRRAVVVTVTNILALLVVWFVLVAPNQAFDLTPATFLRIPLEGLVLAGLALVLPAWGRRTMAAVVGVLLGLLTIVKILDMGFFAAFDRPFNLVTDRGYLGSGVSLVRDSVGPLAATVAVVAAVVLVVAILVCMPLSVGRLTALVARHRSLSARAVTVLVVIWVVCAVSGVQAGQGEPVASMSSGRLAVGQVQAITAGVHDQERFDAAVAVDRFRRAPQRELLAGLGGKDVLVAFVESYGRIAIEGSPSSPQARALLDAGTRRLEAAGYSSRSAFLTSPTFGGLSWLAHATLQSGLWVDNQRRYDRLLSGTRMTLTRAFSRAGWRTVAFMPQNDEKWPEGQAFYDFDKIYARGDIDYVGPSFGFAAVPDQYVLSALQRAELGQRDRNPVMAEIDLVSSHVPWARLPRMIDWKRLGDGSVYERIHSRADSKEEVWSDPARIEAAYVDSITYSLRALISFVEKYGDEDLVLILLGDHQPATIVTGHGASHDVPITVIAQDSTVLDRISGWGWQDGMRPGSRAPVWRMDAFRDRLLAAYSVRPAPVLSRPPSRLQP